jgi:hypothetical protein
VGSCPYSFIKDYYDICPDNTGVSKSLAVSQGLAKEDVMFMRAKTTQGLDRRFLETPLGINSLRDIPKRVNDKLPEGMKVIKATGHSGRRTFVTAAIDAGVSDSIVSQSSKHKDMRMLQTYHKPSVKSLLSSGLAIGGSVLSGEKDEGNESHVSTKKRQRIICSDSDEDESESRCVSLKKSQNKIGQEHVPTSSSSSSCVGGIVKNYYINMS